MTHKLWGVSAINDTDQLETIQICRPDGNTIIQLMVWPNDPIGAHWDVGYIGCPILFDTREDCHIKAPQGITVELHWGE